MINPKEIKELKKHDDLYHNGDSEISDFDYDTLKELAEQKYPDHPYFLNIGSEIRLKNQKVTLPYVLGSLQKVLIEKDLNKWVDPNSTYIASEKLDGISIFVKYVDGKVIQATTRGNGTIGQDITEKAKYFCPTPKDASGVLEVRGEVLLPGNKYMELGKKNRRNACAGLINQKGIKNCEFLTVKFYEKINATTDDNSESVRLKNLLKNFDKKFLTKVKLYTPGTIAIESLTKKLSIWKKECENDYDIDGIVITKEHSVRENIPFPKDKIAFKINDVFRIAKITGCHWATSRMGKIKPVLEIEPTELQGVEIKNVTGFNHKFITDNKIGTDTEIKLTRSGDVIPHIVEVINPSDSVFEVPFCPSCGHEVTISGVDICCTNENCYSMIVNQISHFFSTMELEYMSNKTIEKLMDYLVLFDIESFYNLTSDQMTGLKGFGEKKITKIISEIKKSLTCKPENLLSAFGIDGVGKTLSELLLKKYSFDDLFSVKDFVGMEGIGEITSEKLVKGLAKNIYLYVFLQKKGLKFIEKETGNSTLDNEIIVLTGTGNVGRKVYEAKIKELGGSIKGISASSTLLVTNDVNSTSGKMKKAKKFGIKIISYDMLDQMIK